jgi:hypothetical protein
LVVRHTFAGTALAEGVLISGVPRWLGHKSIIATVEGAEPPAMDDPVAGVEQVAPVWRRQPGISFPDGDYTWPLAR